MIELAVIVIGGVVIVSAVAEAAGMWLRHHDDDAYTGRTKKP